MNEYSKFGTRFKSVFSTYSHNANGLWRTYNSLNYYPYMPPTILTRLVAIQFQLHFAACESIRLNGHVWCGLNGRYRKAKQKNKKCSKRCWSTLFQTEATWIYFQRQIYLCVLEKNMSSYSWQCGILSSKTIINLILARKQIEGCEACCHNACFVCIKYCCSKKETTQWKTTTTQCVCVRYAMWLHINASFQFVLCLCANEILKACYIHSGALFVVHTSVHDVMVILFCLFVCLFSLFFSARALTIISSFIQWKFVIDAIQFRLKQIKKREEKMTTRTLKKKIWKSWTINANELFVAVIVCDYAIWSWLLFNIHTQTQKHIYFYEMDAYCLNDGKQTVIIISLYLYLYV